MHWHSSPARPATTSSPAVDPAGAEPNLAGVVLCGGASRRMGRDKALIESGGETLLQRVTRRLSEVCHPVFLAPGNRPWHRLGFPVVGDAVADAGPAGALLGALSCSPHPLLAAVAVDMPWIDPTLLRLLSARVGSHDAAVPVTTQGPEPLHAVYARQALPRLATGLQSTHSLRTLLSYLDVAYVAEADWRSAGVAPRFAVNLNHPDDLHWLRRLCPEGSPEPPRIP